MTSRLLAFALALIIGSPTCWCCVRAAPAAATVKRSCCERSAEGENPAPAAPDRKKKSCPCASSMIKRELARKGMEIPPPPLTASPPVPLLVDVLGSDILRPLTPVVFNDTGPPPHGPPIFLRQLVLLI